MSSTSSESQSSQLEPIRVAVTGAAGLTAYCLLYLISNGDVFGEDQPLILHLYDLPSLMDVLQGVAMELSDSILPLLREVITTHNYEIAFKDVSVAFMVGKLGIKGFFAENVRNYQAKGRTLNKFARKDVKVLVVGNLANTNALVCSKFAPSIPSKNFSALSRLDQNRAQAQIAAKLNVPVEAISNVIIWGNYSMTQYPDVSHAIVRRGDENHLVVREITDHSWFKGYFLQTVHNRSTRIISARVSVPSMSAAKAAADHMKDWFFGLEPGKFVSMGVISDGSYGIPEGIVYSFPVSIHGDTWSIVKGLQIDQYSRGMMDASAQELEEERTHAFSITGL